MDAVTAWLGLVLMVYVSAALFLMARDVKRVLGIASSDAKLESEAKAALAGSHRARALWVRRNLERLPEEARSLARRVVVVDRSCWLGFGVFFVLYVLQFVAP